MCSLLRVRGLLPQEELPWVAMRETFEALSSLGELAALEELGWWEAGFRGMLGPLRPYSSDCNPETPGTSGGL